MSECFWPDNEPRIHAMIVAISKSFDCGKKVEIKLAINNRNEIHGDIALVMDAIAARQYHIGDVYAAHFKLVSRGPE